MGEIGNISSGIERNASTEGRRKGAFRASLGKQSKSHKKGLLVHPQLPSSWRTGWFDRILEIEKKFKFCLLIESQQAREKVERERQME